MTSTTHETAARLDAEDPLASYRDRFVGSETPLVYLDGNSLGRPLRSTGERLRSFVDQEWGGRLIRGWDEAWMDLPTVVGDRIGATCLGAAPGQTVVADSTTVLLYKALRAGVAARPGRTEVVLDRDNFPTDRYVAAGVADELGLTLRWIDVDTSAGVTLEQVQEVVGEQTAVVLLSHVAYRSAWLADAPAITAAVHDAGALVLWDLSHSVGSVPLELDAWGVDLAVGCTYKYLNGGPGAPAFTWVAPRHQDVLRQPITGWMGHAAPFAMARDYTPAPGMTQWASGTHPVLALSALDAALDAFDGVTPAEIRAASLSLTDFFLALLDERLPDLEIATPREHARRGSQVSFRHPHAYGLVQALIARGVIGDFRDPDIARFGFTPLYVSHTDVLRTVEHLEAAIANEEYADPAYSSRNAVT